jgi:hypothetical protein
MTSEPETSSPYGTRNKRRKLNEITTPPTIPRQPPSGNTSQSPAGLQKSVQVVQTGQSPIYSRNLDKALKSILSESPRMRNSRGGGEPIGESIEVTPSLDDEGSSSAMVPVRGNGQTPSISMSSPSRETTPSSSLGGHLVDIPPFIEFFEKEKERGKISREVRDEALKMLREWRSEWYAEDKRVRELKRKIKGYNIAHTDVPPPSPVTIKDRGRSSISRTTTNGSGKGVDTPKQVVTVEPETPPKRDSPKRSESGSESKERRESITGPNGLTGNYWSVSSAEMGRGNRRKKEKGMV